MENKRVVLFLGGGGMTGAFGAGFVSEMEKMNVYDRIAAIHANSAGVINAAYYCTRQMVLGAPIYWEELIEGFSFPKNVPWGAAQRIWSGTVRRIDASKLVVACDIDHVMEVVLSKRPLLLERFDAMRPSLFAHIFDVRKRVLVCRRVTSNNAADMLRAAVSAIPYWRNAHSVDGILGIDANVSDPVGLDHLYQKYPDNVRIIVLNSAPQFKKRYILSNFIEGMVSSCMYRGLFSQFMQRKKRFRTDIYRAQSDADTFLVYPPADSANLSYRTDKQYLLDLYNVGREAATQVFASFR